MIPLPKEDASRPLRILLIEQDPIDAGWLPEVIGRFALGTEVVHRAALADASLVLARQPIDAVFLSMHDEEPSVLVQSCCDLISQIGRRPLVAALDESQKGCADAVRRAGAAFVYVKRPIWRTGCIRKQQVRAYWATSTPERLSAPGTDLFGASSQQA